MTPGTSDPFLAALGVREAIPPAEGKVAIRAVHERVVVRDACLSAGFDAYLVKPGEIPELERLIEGDGADSDASKHD